MNKKLNIREVVKIMEKEARERNAPLFKFEKVSSKNPFMILVATMLSARTKDEKTALVCNRLFKKIKRPSDVLKMRDDRLEKLLYGIGFYKTKAKYLRNISKILVKRFDGRVPRSLEELLKLPGVGRKTANIVLARAFGKNTLGVDVHVHRISNRLGLVKTKKPEQTEAELIPRLPKKIIRKINSVFVAYGQTICLPIKPKCKECKINNICPRIGLR